MCSLFILVWWKSSECFLGPPPLARCMVRRRDRVVVVFPMYEELQSSQSPLLQVYWYIRLVFLRLGVGGHWLLRMTKLVIVLLL